MIGNSIQAIILAAGKSNRFNAGRTKILEKICGQEMILYLAKLLAEMEISSTYVVGYKKDDVQDVLRGNIGSSVQFVHQEQQLGTGHAVLCTELLWEQEHLLVLNGDMPLVTKDIIETLYQAHKTSNAVMSFVTAHNPAPNAYGRVVREDGRVRIIEAKDFVGDKQESCCINAGIYLIKKSFIQEYIGKLDTNNNAHEFYITDLVGLASDHGNHVETVSVPYDAIRGVNTLKELWAVEHIKRSEMIENWMSKGVRFSKAHTVHIDLNVTIGSGTVIGQAVQLLGKTAIGSNCTVEPFAVLEDTAIKDNVTICSHTVLKASQIDEGAHIGPFAHVHTNSKVGKGAIVGNFCEIAGSDLGDHSRAQHMVYLGNTQVGSDVYIGAGTCTSDFDGKDTHKTIIKDHANLSGNNAIIAPVTINEREHVGAGCIIMDENMQRRQLEVSCGEGCIKDTVGLFRFKPRNNGAI